MSVPLPDIGNWLVSKADGQRTGVRIVFSKVRRVSRVSEPDGFLSDSDASGDASKDDEI